MRDRHIASGTIAAIAVAIMVLLTSVGTEPIDAAAVTRSASRTTGTASRKPPTTRAAAYGPIVVESFDNAIRPLGPQGSLGSTRSWGTISYPSGAGPYPLVVVLHGAHDFCRPPARPRSWPCPPGGEVANHDGLEYLTEAFARRGFVAVSIGVNGEFSGMARVTGTIAAATIERDVIAPLRDRQPLLGARLDPRVVDLRSVMLVGHSRGAAVAGVIGTRLSVPVMRTVMVAPTADTVDPGRLSDVWTAIVIGSCDGDTGVDGGEFITAALRASRRQPVTLVLASGFTHNSTNETLGPDPVVDGRPACGPGQRLTRAQQQAQLSTLVPDLALGMVDALRPHVRVDGGSRRPIALPTSANGFALLKCPGAMTSAFDAPGTEACHRVELSEYVGHPVALRATWSNPGARLTITSIGAQTGDTIVARLAVDPIATRAPSVTVSLSATTWSREITLPVAAIGDPVGPTGLRRGPVLWTDIRVPVPTPTDQLTLSVTSPVAGGLDIIGIEVLPAMVATTTTVATTAASSTTASSPATTASSPAASAASAASAELTPST
jgi:hypothetical protein